MRNHIQRFICGYRIICAHSWIAIRLAAARSTAALGGQEVVESIDFGVKHSEISLAGGGKGQGIAFDNRTQKVTYMKMIEVQAGLGMGVKKFRTIFVFETKGAMDDFVNNGWEFGGQASAAAVRASTTRRSGSSPDATSGPSR